MKKITFLSYYSGIVDRGVETFALEMSKRLSKSYKVSIVSSGSFKSAYAENKVIKTFSSPPKSSKGIFAKFYLDWQSLKILLFTLKSIPFIARNKPQIVVPLNGGWQTVIVKVLSKFLKYKILISGHAGIGADDAWNLLWRPDVFIALTSAQHTWAKKLTNEVKQIVIPNGVDLHSFNPKVAPAKLDLPKPIVVCASALVPYKNVDLTIKAVAKAKNLSLLVLGDGQLKGQIDSLGKRLLGPRYLRIVVPYSKMPAYYKAANLFTLASKTEAFGISYVEAMACNLPIVTTKDQSRKEIIGDAGLLVNTNNINRYAKTLSFASKGNYKNKPYSQALKFSWNTVAQKYKLVIDSIIATQ